MLQPGETIISISSAGGGYGPAHEREPERVRRDVPTAGSAIERASAVYGVVFDGSGAVNVDATRDRRADLASAQATEPAADQDGTAVGEDPVLALIRPGEQLWAAG